MTFPSNALARFLLLFWCLIVAAPSHALADGLPLLWDTKERLPRPDLTQLKRLRFLTTTDFPPFNFMDPAGRLTGFHIDLARAICAKLSLSERCQIQALPWNELRPALEKGDGEAILAGIAITPQSRQAYFFSRPYLLLPARFVVTRATQWKEPLARQVQGKRIGVLAGSTHERMLRETFGSVKPITYSRPEWLYDDLTSGKIDGVFGDGMRMSFWLGSAESANCCVFVGGPYLSPEFLGRGMAIAVRPDDILLAQAFDSALQAIAVDGTLAELYLRYFPVGFY